MHSNHRGHVVGLHSVYSWLVFQILLLTTLHYYPKKEHIAYSKIRIGIRPNIHLHLISEPRLRFISYSEFPNYWIESQIRFHRYQQQIMYENEATLKYLPRLRERVPWKCEHDQVNNSTYMRESALKFCTREDDKLELLCTLQYIWEIRLLDALTCQMNSYWDQCYKL